MSETKKIKLNKKNIFTKNSPSLLGKFLPYMLFAAFMLLHIYPAVEAMGFLATSVAPNLYPKFIILWLLLNSAISYLVMKFILWIFRLILQRKPYFYLINETTFNETFKFWYFIRTLIFAVFVNLQMFFPYIEIFSPIIGILLSYLLVLGVYLTVSKKIDLIFKHLYFRMLMYPLFIYQAIGLIIGLLTGGVL